MSEHADPRDLNGTLVAALLPLRHQRLVSLGSTPRRLPVDDSEVDPFLAARATRHAPRGGRTWAPLSETTQFHSWPAPVLLARTSGKTSDVAVVFGRSASIVADGDPDAQPLTIDESRAASLWLVPGVGLVLALERITAGIDVAERADTIGRLLMTTTDVVTERQRAPRLDDLLLDLRVAATVSAGDPSVPGQPTARAHRSAGSSEPTPAVHELMEQMGWVAEDSLTTLFGDEVGDLDDMLDLTAAVADLVVPRRTMLAGERLVEGLVVGLASAEDGSRLGVADLLTRRTHDGDDAGEEWQQIGYRWTYDHASLVTDPARVSSLCALRSDARVAVVDLDALSYRHDYLDHGGKDVVRGLLPLAAVLGQIASDHDHVVDALGRLAATRSDDLNDSTVLQRDLGLAREVRTRLELRRLQQPQLLNGPNYRKWTEGGELMRLMAPGALVDDLDVRRLEGSDEALAALDASVHALDAALGRRNDELRVRTERHEADLRDKANQKAEKNRRLVEWALGLVSAAGVVGLFASLASVPSSDRELQTLPAAGLWTLTSLAVLVALGGLGYAAMKQQPFDNARPLAATLLVVGGLTSSWGLTTSPEYQWLPLAIAGVLLLSATLVALLGMDPDASSTDPQGRRHSRPDETRA